MFMEGAQVSGGFQEGQVEREQEKGRTQEDSEGPTSCKKGRMCPGRGVGRKERAQPLQCQALSGDPDMASAGL